MNSQAATGAGYYPYASGAYPVSGTIPYQAGVTYDAAGNVVYDQAAASASSSFVQSGFAVQMQEQPTEYENDDDDVELDYETERKGPKINGKRIEMYVNHARMILEKI